MDSGNARLVQENIELIEQGLGLVRSLTPQLYANNSHEHFTSGIGKHFRHVLDVYEQVLSGHQTQVDYDSRARDERIERDPEFAAERAVSLQNRLQELLPKDGGDRALPVRTEIHDQEGRPVTVASSVERELAHLASHTVHHYAIIGLLAKLQGVATPKMFGVAPSTIRHMERQT